MAVPLTKSEGENIYARFYHSLSRYLLASLSNTKSDGKIENDLASIFFQYMLYTFGLHHQNTYDIQYEKILESDYRIKTFECVCVYEEK